METVNYIFTNIYFIGITILKGLVFGVLMVLPTGLGFCGVIISLILLIITYSLSLLDSSHVFLSNFTFALFISLIVNLYKMYKTTKLTLYKFHKLIRRNPGVTHHWFMEHKKWNISLVKPEHIHNARIDRLFQFYYWFDGTLKEEEESQKVLVAYLLTFDTQERYKEKFGWLKWHLVGLQSVLYSTFNMPSLKTYKSYLREFNKTKDLWKKIKRDED